MDWDLFIPRPCCLCIEDITLAHCTESRPRPTRSLERRLAPRCARCSEHQLRQNPFIETVVSTSSQTREGKSNSQVRHSGSSGRSGTMSVRVPVAARGDACRQCGQHKGEY